MPSVICEAGRRTALWDGMIAGLDLARADLGARLLVLSDGGDTVERGNGRRRHLACRRGRGMPIDIVALTPTVSHAQVLRTVGAASSGQFLLATDVGGLNQAFEEATGSFGGKVAVAAQVPAGRRGQRQVRHRDRHGRRHRVHRDESTATQRGARRRRGRRPSCRRPRTEAEARPTRSSSSERRTPRPRTRRAAGRPDRDRRSGSPLLVPPTEDVEAPGRAGALVLGRDDDRNAHECPARCPARRVPRRTRRVDVEQVLLRGPIDTKLDNAGLAMNVGDLGDDPSRG